MTNERDYKQKTTTLVDGDRPFYVKCVNCEHQIGVERVKDIKYCYHCGAKVTKWLCK